MLYIQAIIVTLLSVIFLIFDTTNKSYLILIIITAGIYLLMYIIFFLAFLKLSFEKKIFQFKSMLLNKIILFSGIIGLIFSIFAECAILMPPKQVFDNDIVIYGLSVIIGLLMFISPAFYFIKNHERRSKS